MKSSHGLKLVLIGSVAAKQHFPDFRESKDVDYLIDDLSYHESGVEYHNCNNGVGIRRIFDENEEVATPSQLYTLKLSHCFWDINWEKTMFDILFFQKNNVTLDCELFKQLYKDWALLHGSKRACLKKTNDDFFKDKVDRKYVHDDIHRAVAYYNEPMFEKLKKDRSSAMLDHNMFLDLSYDDQLKLCREEIYVTALERFLIPLDFRTSRSVAYKRACKLLITSMTKGWFASYIAMNWLNLRKPDDHNFVELFHQNLKNINTI